MVYWMVLYWNTNGTDSIQVYWMVVYMVYWMVVYVVYCLGQAARHPVLASNRIFIQGGTFLPPPGGSEWSSYTLQLFSSSALKLTAVHWKLYEECVLHGEAFKPFILVAGH